jgi:Lrp/AsnC family transcriptional regulator for asnA, asnC and gidA
MSDELDEIDRRIIEILGADGRTSNRSIARALGVVESTVRKRLKRLENQKAMRLAVVCDARVLQIEAFAFLRASVAPSHTRHVAQWLSSLDETSFVADAIGQYNVVALLSVHSRSELADTILEKLTVLDGINSVEIREIAGITKHRWDLVRIP